MNQNDKPSNLLAFQHGIQGSLSMAAAIALFGLVFGVLADVADVSLLNASAMSFLMFAGAAQMVSLTLWDPHTLHVVPMVFTAFVICLRFILMSLTLQPLMKQVSPYKVYPSLILVMDEVWAVTLLKNRKANYTGSTLWSYFLGVGLTFYSFWCVSTIMGVFIGQSIDDPSQYGLDFAFTALFISLLIGMRRGKQDVVPWIIAAVVSALSAKFVPGAWYIVIGALTGSIVGAYRDYY